MPAISPAAIGCAKSDTVDVRGNRRRALRLNAAVMQKTRDMFPLKTAQHLSDITGYSTRACEAWMSERVVIPSDALMALIQSMRGREYLVTAMMDATPRWWIQFRAWWSSIDYAAAEIKRRRKLRELLDEEAQLPKPSAAMLLYDEDFYSGMAAPGLPLARRRVK